MPYRYRKEFPANSIVVVVAEELRSGKAFEEDRREVNRHSEVAGRYLLELVRRLLLVITHPSHDR
jgi:hypothetical protein